MIIKFKKLNKEATIPTKENDTDAGMDLYSIGFYRLPPLTRALIPTGIAWEFEWEWDENLMGSFRPYMKIEGRSGNAVKKGMIILGGVIDEEYRGEIKVAVFNSDRHEELYISEGDKIAQGIVYLIPKYQIVEADSINEDTERGKNGFGSSDKNYQRGK